jgi:hypothetical protein
MNNINGVWVVSATNAYSYDNMEQELQVALSEEEGSDLFFDTVKAYLKEEKSTLADSYKQNGLTLSEYIDLADENNEELIYGIEESNSEKKFTIYRKKVNTTAGTSYDTEEVKVILAFVPHGEKVSFVGEVLYDNVKDVEPLFKEV